MEESKLKNMIILRNLPSNIIDEAIVILKENKKVKKLEKIDKVDKNKNKSYAKENKKGYVLKEAEMIISTYIEELENKKKTKEKINKKTVQRLKIYAYITSVILFIETVIIFIK